jgi:hypothetical protein
MLLLSGYAARVRHCLVVEGRLPRSLLRHNYNSILPYTESLTSPTRPSAVAGENAFEMIDAGCET